MRELTLAIVGIDFPNHDRARSNRRSELMLLSPGTAMALVPEPRNPVDRHAVAVFSPSGLQVGYLSAERAPWIGARIRAGDEVVALLQGVVGDAGYLRVRIGGGAPALPVARERAELDRGELDKGELDKGELDKGEPDKGEPDRGEPDFWPDPEGPEFGA